MTDEQFIMLEQLLYALWQDDDMLLAMLDARPDTQDEPVIDGSTVEHMLVDMVRDEPIELIELIELERELEAADDA